MTLAALYVHKSYNYCLGLVAKSDFIILSFFRLWLLFIKLLLGSHY